jgi:hypothetical protein
MLARFEETDTEVIAKQYQFVGAGFAVVANWLLLWVTFGTESGGLFSLLIATLFLVLAAAVSEIRTCRFDSTTRTLTIRRQRALGTTMLELPFSDFQGFETDRLGNAKLAVEAVTLHSRKRGEIGIAQYYVLRGVGGGFAGYLEDWLKDKGYVPETASEE